MKNEEKIRMTFYIEKDLKKDMKSDAAKNEQTLSAYIEEAIRCKLYPAEENVEPVNEEYPEVNDNGETYEEYMRMRGLPFGK